MDDEVAKVYYQCPRCKSELKAIRLDVPVYKTEIIGFFLGALSVFVLRLLEFI